MEAGEGKGRVAEQEAADQSGNRSFQIPTGLDYSSAPPYTHSGSSGGVMVDYMLANDNTVPANFSGNTDVTSSYHQQLNTSSNSSNVDRTLSFADVMQLAEFGHQQSSSTGRNTGIDPAVVSFLKFPVLSHDHNQLIAPPGRGNPNANAGSHNNTDDNNSTDGGGCAEFNFGYDQYQQEEQDACAGYGYYPPLTGTNDTSGRQSQHCSLGNPVQLEFLSKAAAVSSANTTTADHEIINSNTTDGRDKIGAPANMEAVGEGGGDGNGKSSSSSKRKRPRTIKTSEEVESQRMTHIAVERNRRKQMNEHLRVLRSLMPSSYVQRGDQASIIGGAIEFVRELEQLLQCLESQKRRRLYGDHQQSQARPVGGDSSSSTLGLLDQPPQQPALPLGFPPLPSVGHHQQDTADDHQLRLLVDEQNQLQLADPNNDNNCTNNPSGGGVMLREETAESKSCIADIEVKVLGFDALIKILSRRRPGQLIKAIAALEDLHFTILHTNITTIEQTVLYSFNVQVATEARFNAEDIANSVQQIFTFIHANSNTI